MILVWLPTLRNIPSLTFSMMKQLPDSDEEEYIEVGEDEEDAGEYLNAETILEAKPNIRAIELFVEIVHEQKDDEEIAEMLNRHPNIKFFVPEEDCSEELLNVINNHNKKLMSLEVFA